MFNKMKEKIGGYINRLFSLNEDGILLEYKELYNQNNDMIGWLKIEDKVIDYPIMQTMEDELYYLKRNVEKESYLTLYEDEEYGKAHTIIIG